MAIHPPLEEQILAALAQAASDADADAVWPTASWDALRRGRVLEWSIPSPWGGLGYGIVELLEGYEQLGNACLTTAFILSQREAAVRRIRDFGTETLCRELLPPLARGERFATVGFSHLTTSRQHTQPAVTARPVGDTFVIRGTIPWVTGAARADHIVMGATLDDGQQILAVLPAALPGVRIGAPLPLMALVGSLTSEVHCADVVLERRWVLAGPVERVMTVGRADAGGLETSCLALGLAGAAIDYLSQEASSRPELQFNTERLATSRLALREEMHRLADDGRTPEKVAALRARANTLVLRATQTALTAAKGTGFLRTHPAQRWARQALFFLVWSCPRPAVEATLAFLAPAAEPVCL